jgi:hypothetical protein
MRTLLRLLPLVTLLVVAGVTAPPAAAEVECQFQDGTPIPGCTSSEGPWVSVPKETVANTYGAIWTASCPTGSDMVGTDWNAPTFTQMSLLHIYIRQASNQGIYGLVSGTDFLAVNGHTEALSFQPLLGCTANNAARARSSGFSRATQRTVTHNLRPSRMVTFRHRCRRAEQLAHSASAVGFFKEQPPSARELRDVKIVHRQRRGRAIVQVTTGRRAGDNERVALQVHVTCRQR